MTKSDVSRMAVLFAGFPGAHGTHGEPRRDGAKWEIKGTAKTLREPVTEALFESHLAGERPLGVIPVRADGTCLWGSGDVDVYDLNLLEVAREVESRKYPLVPCRSKSGGIHMFLFAKEPVQASLMRAALRSMMASLGHGTCEIFPKQSQILAERGDLGSWMVLPYFGGTFGGKLREQVGIKKTGAEMTLGEFLTVAEHSRVGEEELTLFAESVDKSTSKKNGAARAPFSDGPPCLQHMSARGFPEGGRNKALFHMGVYFKKLDPTGWRQALDRANQEYMRPPLDSGEVNGIASSLAKKDYEYLCKDEPMCSHCDAIRCRGRKYGVGGGANFPDVESIRKLDTEPPIWFVGVEGKTVECLTEELQDYRRFHKLCMDNLNMTYAPVSQKVWFAVIGAAMSRMEPPTPAPPDAGTFARFRELLEDFCTDRARGENREDLFTGRPVEEDGWHHFRMRDLEGFLRREGVRDMRQGIILNYLERLGAEKGFWNVKGSGVNWRRVRSEELRTPPEVDTPVARQEKII